MKITLDVKDHKVPFLLELLKKYQDFVSIENESTIIAYSSSGKPLNVHEYRAEVMRGYEDIKNGKTSTSEELIERAKFL